MDITIGMWGGLTVFDNGLILSEEQWDPEVFTDTKVLYFLL